MTRNRVLLQELVVICGESKKSANVLNADCRLSKFCRSAELAQRVETVIGRITERHEEEQMV